MRFWYQRKILLTITKTFSVDGEEIRKKFLRYLPRRYLNKKSKTILLTTWKSNWLYARKSIGPFISKTRSFIKRRAKESIKRCFFSRTSTFCSGLLLKSKKSSSYIVSCFNSCLSCQPRPLFSRSASCGLRQWKATSFRISPRAAKTSILYIFLQRRKE